MINTMAAALFRVSRLGSSGSIRCAVTGNNYCLRSCSSAAVNEVDRHIIKQPNNAVETKILQATSVAELLNLSDEKSLTTSQAISIISVMAKLHSEKAFNIKEIASQGKFNAICNVLNRNIGALHPVALTSTLKKLFELGLPDESFIVEAFETDILWKIRKMNLKQMLHILTFHIHHQSTEKQRKIVSEIIEKIQKRWFEISDATEIILLYKMQEHFPSTFFDKLEDRAIELVENMSVEDQSRILSLLGELKVRPIHLMRALSFHMAKHHCKLNVKSMVVVANSLYALNFPDAALLQRLSTDLVPEISCIEKSAIIRSFLIYFGQLKWRHLDLMFSFTQWFQKHHKDCKVQDWVALIMTSAYLNYDIEDEALLAICLRHVTFKSINSAMAWLNFVWALTILGKASPELVASVLTKEFSHSIQTSPGYHPMIHGKKLLNINATAKWEIINYKGPFLSNSFIGDCCKTIPVNDSLKNSVINTLSNYIPQGKFLLDSRLTESGITIDGEFLVDKECKPIVIGRNTTIQASSDVYRVALMVQNYKDFTLHHVQLTGPSNFANRILQKMGFMVMEVPYTEYSDLVKATTVTRLKFLQEKLTNVIQSKATTGKQ